MGVVPRGTNFLVYALDHPLVSFDMTINSSKWLRTCMCALLSKVNVFRSLGSNHHKIQGSGGAQGLATTLEIWCRCRCASVDRKDRLEGVNSWFQKFL